MLLLYYRAVVHWKSGTISTCTMYMYSAHVHVHVCMCTVAGIAMVPLGFRKMDLLTFFTCMHDSTISYSSLS